MQEIKLFNGFLNRDDAPENHSANDLYSAHNFRSTGTGEGENSIGTNLEGDVLKTTVGLPNTGSNITVGSGKFNNLGKVVIIRYNSEGYHTISELNKDTGVDTVIFTDKVDTLGNVNVLDINENTYIADIKVISDNFILFINGGKDVYCINWNKLKTGQYGFIQKEHFDLLKAPNLKAIKAEYISDVRKKANQIKSKLFQFRTQFEYGDNMKSAWSTISKRPIPELETIDSIGDDPTTLNSIKLRVPIGDSIVENINIATREAEFGWQIIKTVSRDYITALTDTDIDIVEEIYEAYDPTTQEYIFLFYNDGMYEPVSDLDTDEYYDQIPRSIGTLEVVNGNIIALGDITEGYPRPEGITLELSSVLYKPELDVSISNLRDFTVGASQIRISGSHKRFATIYLNGTGKAGDIIYIHTGNIDSPAKTLTYTYTLVSSDEGSMENLTQHIFDILPNNMEGFYYKKERKIYSSTSGSVSFVTASRIELKEAVLDLNVTGDVDTKTLNIVKSGTSYQFAVEYQDNKGRLFPIVTDDSMVVNTQLFSVAEGYVPQIGWTLFGNPPEGAVNYQILMSENTKYLNNLYITAIYDADESDDEFLAFNVYSPNRRVTTEGVLAYDFTQGDRVAFINSFTDSSTPDRWFNNPPLDFAISSFEIKVDTEATPSVTKHLIKIKTSPLLNITTDLTGKQLLLELYTPKKNTENIDAKIFYEIGEIFDIEDGEHTVVQGTITQADTYIRARKFLSMEGTSGDVFALPVEDFNFSDDYDSKFWSKGRGRTYKDEVGEVRRKSHIRYSKAFRNESLVNEINRFFLNNIYGNEDGQTEQGYGSIVKMIMRDSYLVVMQETKIGHIPVNISLIEDQVSLQNIAISDKLFNKMRYLSGNVGVGLAKRAICQSNSGAIYFIDPNNGYPCRDGYDGLRVINNKMTKFFLNKLKTINVNNIGSYYDDYNDEWTLILNTKSVQTDKSEDTLVWSEKANRWMTFKSENPEEGFSLFTNVYVLKNGQLFKKDLTASRNKFQGFQAKTVLKFYVTSAGVKTYHNINIHSNGQMITTINGIKTQLGHISDLIETDFKLNDGIYSATFLRDKNTDINNGDRLKGRYIDIELIEVESGKVLEILKLIIKSELSSPRE